ncbi:diguanylate cyclase [Exiguobacterium sp. Leaf187]|uniref:Diguanylate cyclase n=2 Tax=Bacteria TaxID=2 RepID=A0A0V8GIN9_9BACL|nr:MULTISPECIES: GGDEF domain-containing protein [Exiguobacterium]MCQ4089241.1 GGDEF domain-containing protein [Exiguobacterium sp. LL15]KQS19955.1 diguanylate cyclase [Exiguobacterium sp. Leaf187]KSU50042.1 diguanylate cyclase [Exiguobacterium enclense]KTR25266.1 diguanylate cyclase [Exiguobacterium indicum]NTY10560.1 GGDEF domain-containing protein [Exiguobacterium sp. JMULE1]
MRRFQQYLLRSWVVFFLIVIGIDLFAKSKDYSLSVDLFTFLLIAALSTIFVVDPVRRRHMSFTFHFGFVLFTFLTYGMLSAICVGQVTMLIYQLRTIHTPVGRRRMLHNYPFNVALELFLIVPAGLAYNLLGGTHGDAFQLTDNIIPLLAMVVILWIVLLLQYQLSRFLLGENIPSDVMFQLLRFEAVVITAELLYGIFSTLVVQGNGNSGLVMAAFALFIIKRSLGSSVQASDRIEHWEQIERLKEAAWKDGDAQFIIERYLRQLNQFVKPDIAWIKFDFEEGQQSVYYSLKDGRKLKADHVEGKVIEEIIEKEEVLLYGMQQEWDIRLYDCLPEEIQSVLFIQPEATETINCSLLLASEASGEFTKDFGYELYRALRVLSWAVERAHERERLLIDSRTDAMTKLPNYRALQEWGDRRIKQRDLYPFSALMIDLDHFKQINDTYGHEIGDVVLFEVAKLLMQATRITDLVARYGGEEFVILLPNTDLESARIVAERIRETLHANPIVVEGHTLEITASIGIDTLKELGDLASLIRNADRAMYVGAKFQGRDRVAAYHEWKEKVI